MHLALFGLAALIGVSLPPEAELPELKSVWSPDDLPLDAFVESPLPVDATSFDPGGRKTDGTAESDVEQTASVPDVLRPLQSNNSLELAFSAWSQGELLTRVGDAKSSRGDGNGQGNGAGDGAGFFGIPHNLGQRIVYVVDNSLSMNHKYDGAGPAKTRFKRVQVELVNSIWNMEPQQQFYVIFFNSETAAMPARTMQAATPIAKEHYLTWVAQTSTAGAPTDPRPALELALNFQPDIIYFLTDGEFNKAVNRHLRKIRQSRTAIHTFAFGDPSSEGVLKEIAESNLGKYRFIP